MTDAPELIPSGGDSRLAQKALEAQANAAFASGDKQLAVAFAQAAALYGIGGSMAGVEFLLGEMLTIMEASPPDA